MDATTRLAASLHPLEKKVLPLIEEFSLLSMLIANSGLKEVEVVRAVQWLSNKALIKIEESIKEQVMLDKNGIKYLKDGLPERRFLQALSHSKMSMQDLESKAKITREELNVCIGILKKKGAIDLEQSPEGQLVKVTDHGQRMLHTQTLEEKYLSKEFPLDKENMSDEDKYAHESLKKRRQIIRDELVKQKRLILTEEGRRVLLNPEMSSQHDERLTQEMLVSGEWKKKKFRPYDVKINVPRISYGKRHFVNSAAEYARKVWLEMGFKEMQGPLVHTAFWNFDALFTAQDHPVRELQDTFYIDGKGTLPDKKLVNSVRTVHENGGKTGSQGWQCKWDEQEARRLVLRTHTTVLSARTLAKLKKDDLPAKYFAVGKCFRNEALDWSHLFEFNQFEGIVVDPNANFRHLIGYLKNFMNKIGFPQARFRPAYFPYTEPSVEIDAYHPVHKTWIELGGAGIFRPEVTIPLLGKDIPVLAWGPGLDRQMMEYYNIQDIRELYKNDVKQLRQAKMWIK